MRLPITKAQLVGAGALYVGVLAGDLWRDHVWWGMAAWVVATSALSVALYLAKREG